MIKSGNKVHLAVFLSETRLPIKLKWLASLLLLALLVAAGPVQVQGEDTAHLDSYGLSEQAGAAGLNGQADSPKAIASPSTVQIKLLNAGAEPRKVLRFHAKPGDKQSVAMTMKMAMDMGAGDAASPAMKMPAIKIPMDVTIKNVSADGDLSYEMVLGDASVTDDPDATPGVAESMKASLGSMKGLATTGVISSRGFNKGAEMKLPPGANPQMRQFLDRMDLSQFANPLPEEPVGPGAKWEVTMPMKTQGMTINQTMTIEITSIAGNRVNVKQTIVQSAANQTIENPAMPDAKMQIISMAGKGTGSSTLDLGKLVPVLWTTDFHNETSMGIDMGEQKQTMSMKMDMNIRLEAQ